jgi:hypothetical protein
MDTDRDIQKLTEQPKKRFSLITTKAGWKQLFFAHLYILLAPPVATLGILYYLDEDLFRNLYHVTGAQDSKSIAQTRINPFVTGIAMMIGAPYLMLFMLFTKKGSISLLLFTIIKWFPTIPLYFYTHKHAFPEHKIFQHKFLRGYLAACIASFAWSLICFGLFYKYRSLMSYK